MHFDGVFLRFFAASELKTVINFFALPVFDITGPENVSF